MVKCQYCGSSSARELETGKGAKQICLQCLAVEQAQQQTRKPFEMLSEEEYRNLGGWLTVLARIRQGDKPIPENNDVDWKSQPDVPENIVTFVKNVQEP